ncbi:ferredoxin--NADP reductase [Herbaspirillum seropedicae]|uniref:ferredoxin--NADP reductase n=1 Tax=Herbaspirillum seropedicae TaxID=964 RepID=UPI000863A456|nr:ferredoxin--NADP reductase [Herbaspirillum seropedicae]AON53882.1 ferredoxin-NADP+ reductase [Herbaspirillum seropedicae]MDR6396865.1 ferredoxin--NADP+ reductase [Herbaspirillum seropedicae]QDD64000.1 ferredoxin--NADP reductase [Herbaspirillum seropedicae]
MSSASNVSIDAYSEKATCERLLWVHRWTDKLLSFRTTRPAGYRFTAGQFARLGLEIDGQIVSRAYSITSAEHEDVLEYYAIIVPGGQFTSRLDALQPGDPVWVEKLSYGFMTADRFSDGRQLWMLATGTGLGPYVSILQQPEVWQRFEDLVLVHGVRQCAELAYADKFAQLRQQAAAQGWPARLHSLRCVTREAVLPSSPGLLAGRITDLLRGGQLEQAAGLSLTVDDARVMACGNPEMVTEVRELLRQRGMSPLRRAGGGQFVTEDYW